MELPKTIQKMIEALLGPAGKSDPVLRRAVFERTRTGTRQTPAIEKDAPELRELVNKIDERPWTVGDDDFRKLREAGCSEDQIFELTVAAAAGAGIRRLEAGFRALDASSPTVVSADAKHTGGQ